MQKNEAQNAENGSKSTEKLLMRKDEVKNKRPNQDVTHASGLFQRPVEQLAEKIQG